MKTSLLIRAFRGERYEILSADSQEGGIHWCDDETYARQYAETVFRAADLELSNALDFRGCATREDVEAVLAAAGISTATLVDAWFRLPSRQTIADALSDFPSDTLHEALLDGLGGVIRAAGFDGYLFNECGGPEVSIVIFSDSCISNETRA